MCVLCGGFKSSQCVVVWRVELGAYSGVSGGGQTTLDYKGTVNKS